MDRKKTEQLNGEAELINFLNSVSSGSGEDYEFRKNEAKSKIMKKIWESDRSIFFTNFALKLGAIIAVTVIVMLALTWSKEELSMSDDEKVAVEQTLIPTSESVSQTVEPTLVGEVVASSIDKDINSAIEDLDLLLTELEQFEADFDDFELDLNALETL